MTRDTVHQFRKDLVADAELRERFREAPDAVRREYDLSEDDLPSEPDDDADPRSWLINS